jgi:hypothetical protein
MKKKLSNEELMKVVDKIKTKYNSLIDDFKMSRSLLSSFEDRYMEALKKSKDLSVFLLAEIEAVEEFYNKEKERREEARKKRLNKNQETFADKVFDANRKKIEKYQKAVLSFDADEEIARLIGAIRQFLNNYWPALTHIYKGEANSTIKSILGDLHYQLLIKYDYKGDPPITRSYADSLNRFSVDKKKIESEYYYILKETAFLLNKILDRLKLILKENRIPDINTKLYVPEYDQKEWYKNNFQDLSHKECIEKVYNYLSDLIIDFRIKDIRKH